jgi:YQGE family putative transporter
MFEKLVKEYQFYKSHPRNLRLLLMTNLIYALVLPIIEMFVGAYIMRSTSNTTWVMSYQLALYSGIPLTFLINGLLLKYIRIARLYSLGMLLSGASMTAMMMIDQINLPGIIIAGLIMGLSYGFFWANRDFLSLSSTTDENRNYYFSMETFFYTLTFVVIPFLAGNFIALCDKGFLLGGNAQLAYYILTGIVFLLTFFSSVLVHRGSFENPKREPFIFFHFAPLWWKMLGMALLKGLAQGAIVTAPIMLIMRLLGKEGTLGTLQSVAAVLSAVVLYLIGRMAKPQHRLLIFTIGLSIFTTGFLVNSVLFSGVGVIIFMMCITIARPLLEIAYFPILLGVIDKVAALENRNKFAYILNHEWGLYAGRLIGCGMFILLSVMISEDFALKHALLAIAVGQFLSIWVAKRIVNDLKG